VPRENAERFSTQIKAPYIECSALQSEGIEEMFAIIIR
jgi:hypothetical protein